jgi:hypothetical protein
MFKRVLTAAVFVVVFGAPTLSPIKAAPPSCADCADIAAFAQAVCEQSQGQNPRNCAAVYADVLERCNQICTLVP